MKIFLFISALTFIFIFAGCSQQKTETNSATQSKKNQDILGMEMKTLKVDFKANPAEVEANKNTELLFTVKNGKGDIIRDLKNVHEKPMHLLVVSDDLDEFYHLHPEVQSDGVYKTSFTFPNGGNYKLYADFTPLDSEQIVQNFQLRVLGNERAVKELRPDDKFEKTVDNLRVVLKPDSDLTSIKEMMLDFQVFDALTDKPITDLENYLGAKAHFVIISQDLQEFVHAHPVSRDNVKNAEHAHDLMNNEMSGKVAQTSAGGHQHDAKLAGQDAESIVSAHVTFPKPAIYKIFAQFQRQGKVITVPFVIDVKKAEDEKAVDLSNVVIPEGAFKIIVSKDGFTPQEISYKQGQPLRLAFYRADKENCGSEVVFKDLNIKKKLPVGKVVLVDIPTDKPGEFAFACGMDMLKGKIIVQ